MGQMLSFVNDTHADIDMAYDFVCEQLDISSFVDNEAAWNDFYMYWEAADNRNQTEYNFVWFFTLTHSPLTNIMKSFLVTLIDHYGVSHSSTVHDTYEEAYELATAMQSEIFSIEKNSKAVTTISDISFLN